jgi:putative Mg2+ transporter-C (MgtC) family protein
VHLATAASTLDKLERLVADLSLQTGVRAVQWYADETAQQPN